MVEFRHPEVFDGFVAHQVKAFLHFDLYGQAVCVPTALAFNEEPFHCFPSTDEVLVGSSDDVVNAGFPVGGGWSFKEDEGCTGPPNIDGRLKGVLLGPTLEQVRFQLNRVQFTCRLGLSHGASTMGSVFNITPKDVHFSLRTGGWQKRNEVLNLTFFRRMEDVKAHASSP